MKRTSLVTNYERTRW